MLVTKPIFQELGYLIFNAHKRLSGWNEMFINVLRGKKET